ncbi:MAG: TonB-dependent receptor domain-containing protein, partial [Tsuneonella suprasediminis]
DWRDIDVPFTDYVISPHLQSAIDSYDARNGEGAFRRMREESFRTANPSSSHDPFSASLAMTWQIGNGYSAALSLARTERAPNVRELYAYGNNLASNSYEVGLSQTQRASSTFPEARTDVMETAKSINLTFRKAGGPLEFEVGLFHQDIDDYIFARLIETEVETGVAHNYLLYTAADASFTGIDGQVSYQVAPRSRLTVFGDYVGTKLKNEDDNLPRIPPGRLGIRYEHSAGPLTGDLEYYHTFAQDKVAAYETRTGGYDMLNATLSYRLDIGDDRGVEFYIRGTNLLNELAFAHTSFVKDQSPLRGRSIAFGMRQQF